jgi:hypothetical protein
MNKYDAQLLLDMRTFEESIRFESIKNLCNAKSIAILRMTLRNALDLVNRLTPLPLDAAITTANGGSEPATAQVKPNG